MLLLISGMILSKPCRDAIMAKNISSQNHSGCVFLRGTLGSVVYIYNSFLVLVQRFENVWILAVPMMLQMEFFHVDLMKIAILGT